MWWGVIGWSFIPHHATTYILKILHYGAFTFYKIPTPQIGTFEYQRHYRYTFAVVVLGYLIWTMVQESISMAPNFYQILGVAPTADDTSLKLAFRSFAKKYHPDRVGPQGEALFITVRDAFEALKNPTVRFAYDRFGPNVLQWTHCVTTSEYLRHGLTQSIGYHVVALAILVFWTAIGETSPVAFWRYVLFISLLASELYLLLSPSPSVTPSGLLLGSPLPHPGDAPTYRTVLHTIFPHRVAYQHVRFLHQLFLFLSIALSRVAPQFFPDVSKITEGMTHRLLSVVSIVDREVSVLLHTELHTLQPSATHVPLHRLRPITEPSADVIDVLSAEMEKMLIESNIKNDAGPWKTAWEAAVERGRTLAAAASALVAPPTPKAEPFGWRGLRSPASSPMKGMGMTMLNGHASPGRSAPALLNGRGVNGSSASGRMSPPPVPNLELRPGYQRARSISLV
ncbi:hypothetical protein B0H16DRAFT_1888618 [Mycena metata]|uniref:J domain-containing protein n=1 Tax=Mycena metata TaxID=1033252 RepID=A0AAD7IPH2_9AGAR|nr:hypothetical protein B0H16DRAFT_1888618 [Mycena metata]